jgi:putative AbiEi antitoxin of type IV toxin-antitoxin system
MTEADFIAKWEARAAEYEQVGAQVSGATLCRRFLDDLASVRAAGENRILSLTQAAASSGYSAAHLARLVKQGKLRTLRPPASRGRLSFRQGDLPRKPGSPHPSGAGVHELASRLYRGKERHHGRS